MRLKIQGPNPYVQIYRNQLQSVQTNKKAQNKDELKISQEAFKLQNNELVLERKKYVSQIKSQVQSGNYEIDYEKTAEKMLRFWNGDA